ncbi:precorrin-6A/cobalt-precorrin-6A reductase [Picrophilus oshimae]|uniref:Precorrin-6X reductase n=1 Tax=Picrophilus torridus (strain ATCC 700027 / DSM 9790 / JCM 10055 / NBRC 100828 / KAW 2/3) TaxID=1122961 RepID=Q6L327_PICTO|nr:precorrin-6A/cobalt-precorrin-6A reductase [Picrophilus oshimae]AAT42624.1 precorrin-6X reductase [Picrophilus oshimae DSM 9789]
MIDFILKNKINAVIDATHPFAKSIHKTAYDVCMALNILHIRFERKDFKKMQKILFTPILIKLMISFMIAKTLNFYKINDGKNYYFRIVPNPESIKILLDYGVPKSNIIAMEGKFNYMVNYSLMQFFNIDTMITKDSGNLSKPKIDDATDLGIKTIIIKRPDYKYKNMAYTYNDVIKILNRGGICPES